MDVSPPLSAIVAGCHLRWGGVWQRPQQLLSRLALRVPVFVVEEPLASRSEGHEIERHGEVTVIRPLRRRASYADPVDAALLTEVARVVGRSDVALWLYTPMMLDLAAAFPGAPIIYDCMDELAAFAGAPPRMDEREAELLARAALVFCGGPSIFRAKRERAANVKLFASGVDAAFFAQAQTIALHPLMRALAQPRAIYIGVIDERIDYGLIEALAATSIQTVLVGPTVKIDPAVLPYYPNLHYTGQLPYDMLPSLLAGADVAIMPFARNASTAHISPTKTLEYFAAGVPIVSTSIRDVVDLYGDVVTFADTPQAFAEACLRATRGDAATIERCRERARSMDWDAIATAMWEAITAR